MSDPDMAAFPVYWGAGAPPNTGMTLRDWFAGQALAGSYSLPGASSWSDRQAAQFAYAQADAMLRERDGE